MQEQRLEPNSLHTGHFGLGPVIWWGTRALRIGYQINNGLAAPPQVGKEPIVLGFCKAANVSFRG